MAAPLHVADEFGHGIVQFLLIHGESPLLGTVDGPVPLGIRIASAYRNNLDFDLRRGAGIGQRLASTGTDTAGVE
jgi:hypothetical protein